MAKRNSPDILLLPHNSAEAITNSATTLSLQPETLINEDYENKESKEDDESDDTDTEDDESNDVKKKLMWMKSIAKREGWSARTLASNLSSFRKMISMSYKTEEDKEDDENDDTDTEEEEVKTEGDDTDTVESEDTDIEEEEVKAEGDDTDTEESDDTDEK